MIVDTSALVAITFREPDYEKLRDAILVGRGLLPSPAYVEFGRVVTRRGRTPHAAAEALLAEFLSGALRIEPFTEQDARTAQVAIGEYGIGNGRGGTLNLLDLMVYATAKRLGQPILCTGKDFAATDIDIHPASRI